MCRLLLFFFLLTTSFLSAQQAPLLDREIFFDNPEIAGGLLSPDAQWITFLKANKGTMNIWIKKAGEPFDKARALTADTIRPINGYFWTDDSRYILYGQDKGGNENFHLYAVDPFAKADATTGLAPARDLTPIEGVTAQIYMVSKKTPQKMLLGLNDRDQAWHDLYELNIATGERKLLRLNKDRITNWSFDWNEQPRLASRSNDDGSNDILRVDPDTLVKIYSTTIMENAGAAGWTVDNRQFYLETNKDRNFNELVLMDPTTGKETPVEKDPLGRVDLEGVVFNDLTHQLEFTTYYDEKLRIYFKDKKLEQEYNFLKARFPGKEISYTSIDKAEKNALILVNSDTDHGEIYLFDRVHRKLTAQYRARPKLKPADLAPMQPITYKSSDGLEIPAYLTLPKGKTAKGLPLIVIPHGGPWARDRWGFNSVAQFWANRGYAVLQMNFRGSTGYGRKFLEAGNGQWGLKMQDDITWGVKHLVAQGIVDAKKVGILGGSYGGYATLAGVTYTPDLYQAAVAVVAPSNLNTLLASIPAYWESFRKQMYARMGDPATPEGRKWLEDQSPLNYVDRIHTPLMIVQGANDPRVKKAEADQIVVAMREKNLPVSYLLAPDEGHGFRRPVNNMAYLAAAEKFMAEHLGGRYQTSMTPAVAKRLGEITVDVSKVEKPRRAEEAAKNMLTDLKPIRDLSAGVWHYKMTIGMGGQHLDMAIERSVTAGNGQWTVSDIATSAMGNMSDRNTLTPKTLLPVQRHVEQGPAKIDLDFQADMIKGSLQTGNSPAKTFETKTDGPLWVDGAGSDLFLGALPLKEGLSGQYRVFDAEGQAVKTYELQVLRREQVTVNAGQFDAWVVFTHELGDANGTTYWISIEGLPVKYSAVVTAMGGATMEGELLATKP